MKHFVHSLNHYQKRQAKGTGRGFVLLGLLTGRSLRFRRQVLMLFALFCFALAHGETEKVNGITWTYTTNGSTASLGNDAAAIATSVSGAIVIPSKLGGKTVATIGDRAFYGCASLTSVDIPEGVTSIGRAAFYECVCLRSIVLPSTLTEIKSAAFSGCSNLTSVIIPEGVTDVGAYAFYNCEELNTVTIPLSVKIVGDYAFKGCYIERFYIPLDAEIEWGTAVFPFFTHNVFIQTVHITVSGCKCQCVYDGQVKSYKVETATDSKKYDLTRIKATLPDAPSDVGEYKFKLTPDMFNDKNDSYKVICDVDDSKNISEIDIMPRPVTLMTKSATKEYDGTPLRASDVMVGGDGFVAGECEAMALATQTAVGTTKNVISLVWANGASADNYTIAKNEGTLTVTPGKVAANGSEPGAGSLPSGGISKFDATPVKYDGKEHTINVAALEAITLAGSMPMFSYALTKNGPFRSEPYMFTNAGTHTIWYKVSAANYDDFIHEAQVKILPRSVTLTTISATKVYDGMPLLAGFKIGGSGFVAGECEVETVGAQTAVGTSNNTIVLDWAEGALPTNYEITKDEGTLTVTKRPVSIVSKSAQKVYDGTPLTAGFDIGGSGLVEGECKVETLGAQTTVGMCKNVLALSWAEGASPMNYEISKQEGALTVLPRKVTLTSGTASKNCDGVPLSCENVSVSGDGFVGDEGVTTICVGTQTWPGTCNNSFEYSFNTMTEASNYNISTACGQLTVLAVGEVTLASGVTDIPARAFKDCVDVTRIRIPDSVQMIGDDAFAGCTSLVKIDFPAGLDVTRAKLNSWGLSDEWIAQYCRIDDYLIAGATLIQYVGDASVKKLTVPAGIVRIDKRAFASLGSLEEIEFSGTEKIIGKGAFFQDTKLTKVILHEGIEEIGDEAFFGCTKMANVIIPSSVKSVGAHAFKKCTALTNAQISYGVESIGEECFFSDWNIKEVDIPSTVTNIGFMAFGGDSDIRRVKLRADIRPLSEIFSNYEHIREVGVKICDREVVDGCFRDCKELKDVFWEGDCPRLANDGRELYANTWHGDKNETLTTYVEKESTGWDGIEGSDQLPQAWPLVGSCRCSIAHKDLPTYLCQFDSNGGTLDVQDTYQYSERLVKLPPEPVQSGYKFGGWWTQPIGGLRVTENTIFIEGVYTYLWAHWIKGHTVFLDPNGGVIINSFVTYVDESVYGVLPSPVRSGYAFDGWLYDGYKIEPDTVMNTKADHTLLAQWKAAQYKVAYHPNGGTGNLVTEDRVYGETEVLGRNAFVRPGYEFLGWSTHKSATSAEYKDAEPVTSLTVVDGEIIELWAVWKESEAVDPTNVELAFGGDADWFKGHQLVEAQAGGQTVCTPCFWQSGKIADSERSDLTTKVFGAGKIGFWWRVDCEKVRTYKWDHLAFFVDNVEVAWTNGVTEWTYLEFAVDGSREHELIWRYQKDEEGFDGEDCGSVCAVVWTPRLETLEDYAGATNMTLRTDGDAGWFGVKDEVHNQSGSVRSGVITDGQVSSLKSTVDGAGVIRFWWKTDCERVRNYPVDRVLFYVDGVEQAWTNGVSDWVQKHFTITGDGPHNVEWRYVKDEEESSGRDCAWVSEIEWEPLRVPPVVVVSSEITGGKELVVDESWPASLDAQFGTGTSAAFVEKFGSDLSAALLKSTGKKNAAGEEMYVWQDYVAGTDPTDPKSQFTAKIEMVDGEPVVVWSPKLSEAEAAKRVYTTYGKKTLEGSHGGEPRMIEPWTPVEMPAQGGWRFFKVGVEMR